MADIDKIYDALVAGRDNGQALEIWITRANARDLVRDRQRTIAEGIDALERLKRELRDGRKHLEQPDDCKHTSCYCSAPTCSPPCSFCTDPDNNEADLAPTTSTVSATSSTCANEKCEGGHLYNTDHTQRVPCMDCATSSTSASAPAAADEVRAAVEKLFDAVEKGAAPFKVEAALDQLEKDDTQIGLDPGYLRDIFAAYHLIEFPTGADGSKAGA